MVGQDTTWGKGHSLPCNDMLSNKTGWESQEKTSRSYFSCETSKKKKKEGRGLASTQFSITNKAENYIILQYF